MPITMILMIPIQSCYKELANRNKMYRSVRLCISHSNTDLHNDLDDSNTALHNDLDDSNTGPHNDLDDSNTGLHNDLDDSNTGLHNDLDDCSRCLSQWQYSFYGWALMIIYQQMHAFFIINDHNQNSIKCDILCDWSQLAIFKEEVMWIHLL